MDTLAPNSNLYALLKDCGAHILPETRGITGYWGRALIEWLIIAAETVERAFAATQRDGASETSQQI